MSRSSTRGSEPGAVAQQRVASYPGIEIAGAPVGSLLLQAIRAHAARGTEMLRELGVLPPQELVLMELADRGGQQTQNELVRFLARDRSTVTKTLQAMERSNLIAREPSPTDRRVVLVTLTAKGHRLEPRVREAWVELERRTVAQLGEADRRALHRALATVRDSLSAPAAPDASAPRGTEAPSEPVRVAVIVAEGGFGAAVGSWLVDQTLQRGDLELEVIDLADRSPRRRGFAARVGAADAFVVVTPEHNHGYPGALKLAIDSVGTEWHAKPVAFVSYGGNGGGVRAVEQLRQVFAELHTVTIRDAVSFPGDDDRGRLEDAGAIAAAATTLDRLSWWGRALRAHRREHAYGG